MKSKFIILTVCICAAIFAYGVVSINFGTRTESNTALQLRKPNIVRPPSSHKDYLVNDPASDSSELDAKSDSMDAADYAAANEWISSRGYFLAVDTAQYESLSEEALANIADNGDIIAMQVLADKYLQRYTKDGSSESLKYFKMYELLLRKAAAYGSTAAITRIGNQYKSRAYFTHSESTKRVLNLMALSFFEVALIRGDRQAEAEMYFLKSDLSPPLTNQEIAQIKNDAKELYDSLVESRERISGLDKFDNSIPDYVDRYYDQYLAAIIK